MILFVVVLSMFFFFKQKTAYEMRISDWSSDVCSSDLCSNGKTRATLSAILAATVHAATITGVRVSSRAKKAGARTFTSTKAGRPTAYAARVHAVSALSARVNDPRSNRTLTIGPGRTGRAALDGSVSSSARSEEHTSELQ